MKQDTMEDTIVQDYRAYTADEILRGILEFSESRGWTDPANLGHWLGAIQRWADGFSPTPEIRYQLRNWHHISCHSIAGAECTCLERREALITELSGSYKRP